jgi:hypothetical protein
LIPAKPIPLSEKSPAILICATFGPGRSWIYGSNLPKVAGDAFHLAKATLAIDPLRTLHVERSDGGEIGSRLDEKEVTGAKEARRVTIDGSVYGSADRAGVPDSVTANTIRLFSYAIDFQRDIKEGDKMEVMYDSYKTEDGYVAKNRRHHLCTHDSFGPGICAVPL